MSNKTIVQAKFGGHRVASGTASAIKTPAKLEALANSSKANNNARPLAKESASR